VHELNLRMSELFFGTRPKPRLDEVAGHDHRPHPPPARASDIGGLQPIPRRHQPDDRAMFRMGP